MSRPARGSPARRTTPPTSPTRTRTRRARQPARRTRSCSTTSSAATPWSSRSVDDGQVLTLYWGWRNERDDDADFRWDRFGDGDGDGAKLRLLDLANGKRYQVLKDENGDCLCSHTDNVNTTLPPEGTKIMTNLYPLPEDDVDTLTLTTPQDGNIDGIAISEQ